MLNAVRTWLLNRNSSAGIETAQGGEYAPSFIAPPLDANLAAVHAALFGGVPDPLYANYRVRQYLTLLHAGDYEDHVLSYDPRVTYDPRPPLVPYAFGTTVAAVAAGNGTYLMVLGQLQPDDARGKSLFQWLATLSSDTTTLTISSRDGYAQTRIQTLAYTDGLSAGVPLPGSALMAVVSTAATGGSQWLIDASARPLAGPLDAIAGVAALGHPATAALFGELPVEPYLTYKNLWFDHPEPAGRLTGVLLAFARRVGELSGQV